ncbi:MAG: DNA polymerase III subunit gamma/tau [Chloroflexi bacterium]|nr:DNA polymerase III subunit gamma/tau [Chloroflexota bacterium]
MSGSQVFYRKWRPQTLADVVGQPHVTRTLLNALESDRVAHAYLFCGPRGTGKTSTGRILAKAVNCLSGGRGDPCNTCAMCRAITDGGSMDVVEIDAASNRGIDEIRELRERVGYAPGSARRKVYIIDEVHMLTDAASNALLKTLEEPPPHAIFILATTEPHKMLTTIISRCQRFDFRRISQSAVVARLEHICQQENLQVEAQALKLVARGATGSLRDAENLLEQLVAYYGDNIGLNQVRAMLGVTGDVRARELAGHILNGDVAAGLAVINGLSSDGLDLAQFNRELVEWLRWLLLVKAGAEASVDATAEDLAELRALASRTTLDSVSHAVRRFAQVDLRFDRYSSLPVELALVDCCLAGPEAATAGSQAQSLAKTPGADTRAKEQSPPTAPSPAPKAEASQQLIARAPSPVTQEPVAISAEKPAKAPAPLTALEEAGTIEFFRKNWGQFVQALRGEGSGGNLDAFLRSACEPVALEKDTLVLGFYHSFHKEKIENPKYLHLVEKKLNQVFGGPYRVKCVLTEQKKKTSEHLIKAALEMGARIVDREDK